jgi:two-component system sensor histidine kinase MprB
VPPEYLGAANTWVLCLGDSGAVGHSTSEMGSVSLGSQETAVIRGERRLSVRTIVGDDDTHWRVVALNRGDHTMILGQSLAHQQSVLGKLGIVMFVFGGLGVAGAGVAGWLVARNGLRPVRRLTKAVEGIARTEDLTPLPLEGDDEIARLATAFNEMLQALDSSRQRQRQLVADAGHELRTPMTALRTNIDLLAQATLDEGPVLDPEARAELLHDIRAQIEELTQLIGDLTELSRDKPPASVIEDVEISEVVHRAAARVRLRAPSVQFDVVAHPWWVTGDAAALERAVTNLLDNAAKWSPADGHVSCRLVDGVLTVDDEGTGIPEADREKVFDRFWRSSESRTMPGSGLGLSIVRQVTDRHAGSVEVGSAPGGGARLVMTLPGTPDEPER